MLRSLLVSLLLLGSLAASAAPAAAPAPSHAEGMAGDANGDGVVDISDVFFLINYIFAGGPGPQGTGDANADGNVDISDVFFLINYIFANGPAPIENWLEGWPGFAYIWDHSAARGHEPAQPLQQILWQTPVDLAPQYSGSSLLIHYGSPIVTARNQVLVTVKTGATDGFRVECRRGTDGSLVWTQVLDYTMPPHDWPLPVNPTLTPMNNVVMPAAGGTVFLRPDADRAGPTVERRAFYGLANYLAASATYDANVKISTPITSDAHGNVFFGFEALGATPAGLVSGLARLAANGTGMWIAATTAAADASIVKVTMNCAPAVTGDGARVYVTVRDGAGRGYLVSLNGTTLAPISRVRLKDPKSNADAEMSENGTASPTIGPDGDVYQGVNENPFGENHFRGWMLHFDSTLAVKKTPGAFGWDTTPGIVPAVAVPSYSGTSEYLLLTKYNHYAQGGGDGQNKVAVLDPFATQTDPVTGATVMKEILTVVGPTHDDEYPSAPNAVKEWCINTAAIDVITKCALINSEDGKLYRWDFTTNSLTETVVLTPGLGEAYTPTCLGADGTVYAINNATLFAVGAAPPP